MSDNEDLLGDDLGDHSLADYNLGNDEEDQLLADDYEGGSTQNVPTSVESFREPADMVPTDYSGHGIDYGSQPTSYPPVMEAECVVPNIIVEVPIIPLVHSTYAPYEPRHYKPEQSVPLPMPAAPIESPQIVPSEVMATIPSDMARERFISERPVGAQRMPQVRDIPDSLDKVVVSGNTGGRGGRAWRSAQYSARFQHPYRRNNQRGNFSQRNSFPPQLRPLPPPPSPPLRPPPMPQIRLDIQDRPMDMQRPMPRPPFPPERLMEMSRPTMDRPRPIMDMPRPRMDMPRPLMDMPRPRMDMQRPSMDMPRLQFQQFQRYSYREERPMFNQMRPPFERPIYYPRQQFQRFCPPMPQVTIRQNVPDKKEPEIRMLPVPLPSLPGSLPSGLAGKKVLINPHFKGNFQPVEGLSIPAYIPTRIQRSPPRSPPLDILGPIKDIDDAAERFIAEQRNALARAAGRKFGRRSPQRYIENTTIEIENDLARVPTSRRRSDDDDLLRRQEEFIHANRAGLRRRMRSPSPVAVRRSPSPGPRPCPAPAPLAPAPAPALRRESDRERERRHRPANDEDIEYKRRVREQEDMRERVLRAKEVRRRKNAALYIKQMQDREKEENELNQTQKETNAQPKPSDKPGLSKPIDKPTPFTAKPERIIPEPEEETKPDTTRKTPEREWTPEIERERTELENLSPAKKDDEVNSTYEELTPPPQEVPPRVATPPVGSDDELELILGDIDGILSDDDLMPKEKPKPAKVEPAKPKPVADLRGKLPPRDKELQKQPRLKITFSDQRLERRDNKRKGTEKSPPRKPVVSSTKVDDSEVADKKPAKKLKQEQQPSKARPRIMFQNKGLAKQPEKEKPDKAEKASPFSNRRVILQRNPTKDSKSVFSRIEISNDPTKPNPGIFSRAVRTITDRTERDTNRIVIKKETKIEYDSSSDDEERLLSESMGSVARVHNLPHGMTDTRLRTLAGELQSLVLDKEERTAKITFKTSSAAETFRKKFNNKMVAASRLTVTLQ